jgi:hypothetical protein
MRKFIIKYKHGFSKKQKKRRERRKIHLRNFKEILFSRTLSKKLLSSFVLSTTFFLLTFLIVFMIYQLATILAAGLFDLPVIWYFNQIRFPLPPGSPLYTRSALIIVFAVGPFVSFLLAIFFLRLYYSKNPFLKSIRLFSIWGIINSLNMIFGAYIVGCLTRTDFVYTSEWIMLNNPFDFRELILTTLSMLIMVLIGWQLTSLFLVSSGSKTIVSRDFRPFYIFVTVVLPWVIGGILLFILTSPKYYTPFELKTMTQGFMLLPSLFTYNSVHNDTSIALGVTKRKDLNWSVVIVSFMLLFLFRIFLNFGMRFHF